MGITKELKETYEYYKFLDKCSLNNIIAEDIRDYVNMYLLEEDKEDIINEFGSVDSFSHITAENFTRNDGNFLITEENVSEWAGFLGKLGVQGVKQGLKWAFKGGVKKGISQGVKVMGKSASKRLGAQGAKDVLKFVGKKSMGRITYTDVGKYVSRDLVKGATPKVARQLEKQGAWLAKHSGMDATQMSTFMQKYAVGPHGCDPKLWTKAFQNTAKNFNGGVKMTDDLVIKEYNALAAKAGKQTLGTTAGKAIGGGVGSGAGTAVRGGAAGTAAGGAAGGAVGGTTAGSIAGRAGRALLKAPIVLAKGTGKVLKKVGLFCLRHPIKAAIGAIIIYEGWKWIKGKDGLFRRIQRIINALRSGGGAGAGGGAYLPASLEAVYPKSYGAQYLGENPEDYRVI